MEILFELRTNSIHYITKTFKLARELYQKWIKIKY